MSNPSNKERNDLAKSKGRGSNPNQGQNGKAQQTPKGPQGRGATQQQMSAAVGKKPSGPQPTQPNTNVARPPEQPKPQTTQKANLPTNVQPPKQDQTPKPQTIVTPIAAPVATKQPEAAPVIAQPTPSKKDVNFSQMIPRTQSAPPNLQEQEQSRAQHQLVYIPEKANKPVAFNYNAQPFYPSGHPHASQVGGFIPPGVQMFAPMMPPQPQPQPPQSRRLKIIDPTTKEEVVIEDQKVPRATVPLPSFMAMGPYPVVYPYAVPPGYPGQVPHRQMFPEFTNMMGPPQPKPIMVDPKAVDPRNKFASPTKSPQAKQEFRVKSPGPQGKPEDSGKKDDEQVSQKTDTSAEKPTTSVVPTPVAEPPKEDTVKEEQKAEQKPVDSPKPPAAETKLSDTNQDKKDTGGSESVAPQTSQDSSQEQPEDKPIVRTESMDSFSKRVYDRDFLLKFQPVCVDKPEELGSVAELLAGGDDRSIMRSSGSSQTRAFKDGSRDKMRSSDNLRSSKDAPPGFGRTSKNGPMSPSGRRVPIKRSKTPQPSDLLAPGILAPTPGRWEPTRAKRDLSIEEAVLRKAKGLLNKLTEDKFEPLSDKILNVGIDTPEILSGIIKLVFDKAVSEPKFVSMYADLCNKMSTRAPTFPSDEEGGKPLTFKRLLLNRCQEEFESIFKATPETPQKPQDETIPQDEKPKSEEDEFIAKKRMLGNMTFIGELFKNKMLTERIIHECLIKLLGDMKNPSLEDMEALCKLMTTVGPILDHSKAQDYMDKYFARMKELSRNKLLPSRIRFMIQDVIQLRQAKWVSKKEANILSQQVTQNPAPSKAGPTQSDKPKYDKQGSAPSLQIRVNDKGTRTVQQHPQQQSNVSRTASSDSDWEMVPSKGKGRQQQRTSQTFTSEEVKLRPQTFGMVGAKGWNSTQPKQQEQEPKGRGQPPRGETKRAEAPRNTKDKEPSLSQEELEKRTDDLLEEYFSSSDLKEATECIKELNAPSHHTELINKLISIGIEKKQSERQLVGKLIASLHEDQIITSKQIENGFKAILEILDDLIIDIPKAGQYIADFIASALADGCVQPVYIADVAHSVNPLKATRVIADIFRAIADTSSHRKLREIYAASKYDIQKLFKPENRNTEYLVKFLETENLTALYPHLTYEKQIELMIAQAKDAESVTQWIKQNVPNDDLTSSEFCSNLTSVILRYTLENPSNQEQILKNLCLVLRGILTDRGLQVQCLKEADHFNHTARPPKGFIDKLFQYLYECRAVSRSALNQWLQSRDSSSKDSNIAQLSKWIQQLPEDEAEQDEDEEDEEYVEEEYDEEEEEDE